jgi:hypothetical protein
MRAKMRLNAITNRYQENDEGPVLQETLQFAAVAANKYPEDGSDEDNTYAKFSPSGVLSLTVANPALIGKFEVGEKYYLDFHRVD